MMGGPSSEHEVSLASGRMVYEALAGNAEYAVQALVIDRQGHWSLEANPKAVVPAPADAKAAPIPREYAMNGISLLKSTDVVFLAFHGAFGEDGTLQGLLEALGIPYTGSGPLASALAMNKGKAKELFRYHQIPVARELQFASRVLAHDIHNAVASIESQLGYPVVVKPNTGGSSVGVAIAEERDQLVDALQLARQFGVDVMVEEKLSGREVTCAVLEELDGGLRALPIIEIVPKAGVFFDFQSKYADGGADEICPAPLDPDTADLVQKMAIAAHEALGCEGFSRTDLFLTPRGVIVLEVNTIPGMTPNSLLPKAARAAGISFEELMDRLVRLALKRFRNA
ncbi:MAG: D-alanine--D-alanine ligase [Sulfobacillus benefaciens]|uniref:D-alanine--D-alanine ligase n=1 Tax=Sulfobacillus benefaciens TaxID=453960 RepID=A0A2T2X5C1_9FIRM|nr:MAG: D-alanine--D-alanine ligase [Sulfobacillus benefaciens]